MPSWRGKKIPPQAKKCDINKKLPSWRGHKIPNDTHPGVSLATFTHSVRTQANAIKFAHQSLCNPKISTLLKAIRRGFLKGCPNLLETLILKYLNPSLATAKGHMKCPHHGIKSTQPKQKNGPILPQAPIPQIAPQSCLFLRQKSSRPTPARRTACNRAPMSSQMMATNP
jgi:hypothetical protein